MKLLLALTLLCSTAFGIKSNLFTVKFEYFAEKFIEKYETFNEEQWEENIEKYLEYRIEYKEIADQLSESDRNKIDQLNHKVNAIIIKNKASKVFGKIGDIVNEATGTVKELIK